MTPPKSKIMFFIWFLSIKTLLLKHLCAAKVHNLFEMSKLPLKSPEQRTRDLGFLCCFLHRELKKQVCERMKPISIYLVLINMFLLLLYILCYKCLHCCHRICIRVSKNVSLNTPVRLSICSGLLSSLLSSSRIISTTLLLDWRVHICFLSPSLS